MLSGVAAYLFFMYLGTVVAGVDARPDEVFKAISLVVIFGVFAAFIVPAWTSYLDAPGWFPIVLAVLLRAAACVGAAFVFLTEDLGKAFIIGLIGAFGDIAITLAFILVIGDPFA